MEAKMYYTDYFKAAIMSRDFGVNYVVNGYEAEIDTVASYSGCYFCRLLENAPKLNRVQGDAVRVYDRKFYIHPSSLHIFDPMEGDVVEFVGQFDSLYGKALVKQIITKRNFDYGDIETTQVKLDGIVCPQHSYSKIIQRNGKAFFMPEVEV